MPTIGAHLDLRNVSVKDALTVGGVTLRPVPGKPSLSWPTQLPTVVSVVAFG